MHACAGADRIAQSIPIMEYLDEKFGTEKNPLLPADLAGRARVRAISQYIISEIQPLQSTRVDAELKRLVGHALHCAHACKTFCLACVPSRVITDRCVRDMPYNDTDCLQNVDEKAWKKHWITLGFQRLEAMLSSPETGIFCHGDAATMADCCLIPQARAAHMHAAWRKPSPMI